MQAMAFGIHLVCHYLADYYMQTAKIAAKKTQSYYYTFIHSVLYALPFFGHARCVLFSAAAGLDVGIGGSEPLCSGYGQVLCDKKPGGENRSGGVSRRSAFCISARCWLWRCCLAGSLRGFGSLAAWKFICPTCWWRFMPSWRSSRPMSALKCC